MTAVEWLVNELKDNGIPYLDLAYEIIEQALEMEKQQAERSYSKEEVDDLLDRLLEGNMCSVVGEELIEKFQKK